MLEIKIRIQRMAAAFSNLQNRVFSNDRLSFKLKFIRLFNTLFVSNRLYGCTTWNTKQKDIDQLDSFQYRSLKKILNISWQDFVSYQELLLIAEKLGCSVIPIECKIRESRLKYVGHIERMENHRLPKIVLHGSVCCGNRFGRCETNFRDCVRQDMHIYGIDHKKWQWVAVTDRARWRQMIFDGRKLCLDLWNKRRNEKSFRRHLNDGLYDHAQRKKSDGFRVSLSNRLEKVVFDQEMDARMLDAVNSGRVSSRKKKQQSDAPLKCVSRVRRLLAEYEISR